MNITAKLRQVRAERAVARIRRAQQRRLEWELAQFRTPAELLELELLVDRHDPQQAGDVRQILDRQARARIWQDRRVGLTPAR